MIKCHNGYDLNLHLSVWADVPVSQVFPVSLAFKEMSWCNTACVVFYFGMLSAFEATGAQTSTAVQPVNCSPPAKNGVCRPHLTLPRPWTAGSDGNDSLSWEIAYLVSSPSVFCLLLFFSTSYCIGSETHTHKYMLSHADTHEHECVSQRKWEGVRLSLRVVCTSTQHTHSSYVGRFPDLYRIKSPRVFAITPILPACVTCLLKWEVR